MSDYTQHDNTIQATDMNNNNYVDIKEVQTFKSLEKMGFWSGIFAIFLITSFISLIIDIMAIIKIVSMHTKKNKILLIILFAFGWWGWIGVITSFIAYIYAKELSKDITNN